MTDVTPNLPKEEPQFTLKVPADGPVGAKLFFKGQEVAMVTYLNVENTLDVNEPLKSRLTLELVGEVVAVERAD